jgi:hypothetical protein
MIGSPGPLPLVEVVLPHEVELVPEQQILRTLAPIVREVDPVVDVIVASSMTPLIIYHLDLLVEHRTNHLLVHLQNKP